MDFEKIYTDCREKIFFLYINYWGALKAPSYRNRDALPESAPFYKKLFKNGALACKRPIFKKGALCFTCLLLKAFFNKKRLEFIF
jgi:hypothetical protein